MIEKNKIKSQVEETDPDLESAEEEQAAPAEENIEVSLEAETETDPVKEMETRIETLEQEAKSAYDRFLRVSAEFDNYKKRTARELNEFRKYANETLLKELLTVVDNLERAVTSAPDDEGNAQGILEGVDLTLKDLRKIFEKFSVKSVEALGTPFDPAFHQAVMQEESVDYPENTVSKELLRGYLYNDRLLRPAMVVVSKGTPAAADPSETSEDDSETK